MKRTISQIQYTRLLTTYYKLTARLNRHFSLGRFHQFSKHQQYRLLQRLERIKAQLVKLESCLKLAGTCLFVGATFLENDAAAQFAPVGSEFLVNSFTTDIQRQPALAMDADGDFVMLWQSEGQDGSDYGIYGQRYNNSGVAQNLDFQINMFTTGDQSKPSVAVDTAGDFVVVWQSDNQDGNVNGVYARRYDALGVAQGDEFQVNTRTIGTQFAPSVAMDVDGDYVVVWESNNQDGSGFGIYGQRYNALGVAQGSEFRVNTHTTDSQKNVSIAMNSDGDYVVVWESNNQDGSGFGIYGQRYNALGVAQGSEFRVNTYTTDSQKNVSIAMNSDGDFVVVWQSENQDGSGYGVYGQRYNASGVAQGSEFSVNTYTSNNQSIPLVAMDSDGDFTVIWESYGQDGSDYGVYAQRYNGGFATPTAIQNAQEVLDMNLYPNPAKDEVHFNVEGEVSIKLLTLSGQVLRQEVLENQTFHVSGLKPGLYLVEIEKEGEKKMKKLVVE